MITLEDFDPLLVTDVLRHLKARPADGSKLGLRGGSRLRIVFFTEAPGRGVMFVDVLTTAWAAAIKADKTLRVRGILYADGSALVLPGSR